MKYSEFSIFISNLLRNFIFNVAAIGLLIWGIWDKKYLYAGSAVLLIDMIWAFVKTKMSLRKVADHDNEDIEHSISEKSYEVFLPEDTPEVAAIKRKLKTDSTVDEIIEVFREHCTGLGSDDLLLFETGAYSFYGEKEFYFCLVRQTGGPDNFVQLHLNIIYAITPGNRRLHQIKWSDRTDSDFFEYIRTTREYKYAQENKYLRIVVFQDCTD